MVPFRVNSLLTVYLTVTSLQDRPLEAHAEEIIGKAQELTSLIHPDSIKLMDVDYTDYYYKALFVRAESSASILAAME